MIYRIVAALALLIAPAALADIPSLPGEEYIARARFPYSSPTAVVVDVVDVTNPAAQTQIGNDVAATQVQIDSADSDTWVLDLSTVAGFAVNCEQKSYLVRFVPDSADCSDGADPDLCVVTFERSGGSLCKANPRVQVSYTLATGLFPSQGITQQVRTFYNRQGTEPIRWRRLDVADDLDFSTPDFTKWEVYFYEPLGSSFVRIKCSVDTESDPAVSLPSSASCS